VSVSRVLTVWGLSEPELHGRLDGLVLPGERTHVALLGSDGTGARLRVVAGGGADVSSVDQSHDESIGSLLEHATEVVAAALGDALVSAEGRSPEEMVIDLAGEQGLTIGVAESLTCGAIATRLGEPPGGGRVFAGAVVAYLSEVKHRVLDVPPGPVVSPDAAAAMAAGVARLLDVDTAVAATGVAGPDPQDGQPVGTVFVATHLDGVTQVVDARAAGDRQQIRDRAATAALNILRLRLLDRRHRSAGAD
jgi:PncC family amidohydrolase